MAKAVLHKKFSVVVSLGSLWQQQHQQKSSIFLLFQKVHPRPSTYLQSLKLDHLQVFCPESRPILSEICKEVKERQTCEDQ
jgi:hypothetical protein